MKPLKILPDDQDKRRGGIPGHEKHLKELIAQVQNEELKAAYCLFIEGYEIRTIALLLDRNENTIKSDLRRARLALEEIIERELP